MNVMVSAMMAATAIATGPEIAGQNRDLICVNFMSGAEWSMGRDRWQATR